MASLTKQLYYAKSGTNKTIKLYSAKSDCLDTTTGPFVHVDLDGTIGYAGLISGDGKGSYPSDMRVEFNGSTYTVQECGYHRITITQPSNGQIKVTHNGTDYTTSFDAMMEGVYIVNAQPSDGYELIELKVNATDVENGTSQIVGGSVSITATMAILIRLCKVASVTPLTDYYSGKIAATVGNYALIGGGSSPPNYYTTMDAYNSSLTKSSAPDLTIGRVDGAATATNQFAFFTGGNSNGNFSVDVYNSSLTKSSAPNLTSNGIYLAATSIGGLAFFGGGGGGFYTAYAAVDVYNSSLTKTVAPDLSVARGHLAATSIGDYALFAGGRDSSSYTIVDAYNSSLTKTVAPNLSVARDDFAATSIGDYALFAGGYSNKDATVEAYNSSLTKTVAPDLSVPRSLGSSATSVGDFAIFAGGYNGYTHSSVATVDAYNRSLTRSSAPDLSEARSNITAATSVGDYALFAGGYTNSDEFVATVDAYYQE